MENVIAGEIIGYAIDIHKKLGPGLLENVYKECLYYKLNASGWVVQKEVPLPVHYENVQLPCGYRVDLIVEKKVLIEVKSIESIHPIHIAQTLTYLRLGNFKLALLINFNSILLKDGIKRVINGKIS